MSNLLEGFGIDPEDFEWQDVALCRGISLPNIFYELYESDARIAVNADEMCMSCPVAKFCFESGVENKEIGCWGGVYLDKGRIDDVRNMHKTEEVWERLKGIHGESLQR